MIKIRQKGDFTLTKTFFKKVSGKNLSSMLSKYGEIGVKALSAATPVDSGLTASSWYYEVEQTRTSAKLVWKNSNINKGVNIAIILQMGHGTGTGGWVEGRDYINPAMQPVFDKISEELWKEVTSA